MRLAIVLVLALGCGRADDPHLARARQLIGSGQWANARTELGQVLARDAHSADARALLVYCLDREDGLRRAVGTSLTELYRVTQAIDHADWKRAAPLVRKVFDGMYTDARKKLFDKGVDTQDARDLTGVLVGAARESYARDDDPERKPEAASVLAGEGDAAALGYLITQLKGEHPAPIVDELVALGARAIDPLRAAITDVNFIGRRAALDALARIQAGLRAHALIASHPALGMIQPNVPGARRMADDRVAIGSDPEVLTVETLYAAIGSGGSDRGSGGSPDDGVALIEAWDDGAGGVVGQLFAARDGDLVQLTAFDHGETVPLGGPSALYGLAVDHGRVSVRRVVARTTQREVDARLAIAPGVRVRLPGYEPRGEVVRDDGGLWLVKLDQPIQGMAQMSVPASALVALRREPYTETSIETLTGTIHAQRWDLTQRESSPDASPEPTR